MKLRSTILWGILILILGLVNYGIFQKEQLRTNGQVLYLELAPVDPRSLIQGDYMRLDYALLQDLRNSELPERGQLLIEINDALIGTQGQVYDGSTPLSDNQVLVNYYDGDGWLRIGAENYFFQEGQGSLFEDAEYAELRVSASGELILAGLLDAELNRLGEE